MSALGSDWGMSRPLVSFASRRCTPGTALGLVPEGSSRPHAVPSHRHGAASAGRPLSPPSRCEGVAAVFGAPRCRRFELSVRPGSRRREPKALGRVQRRNVRARLRAREMWRQFRRLGVVEKLRVAQASDARRQMRLEFRLRELGVSRTNRLLMLLWDRAFRSPGATALMIRWLRDGHFASQGEDAEADEIIQRMCRLQRSGFGRPSYWKGPMALNARRMMWQWSVACTRAALDTAVPGEAVHWPTALQALSRLPGSGPYNSYCYLRTLEAMDMVRLQPESLPWPGCSVTVRDLMRVMGPEQAALSQCTWVGVPDANWGDVALVICEVSKAMCGLGLITGREGVEGMRSVMCGRRSAVLLARLRRLPRVTAPPVQGDSAEVLDESAAVEHYMPRCNASWDEDRHTSASSEVLVRLLRAELRRRGWH